MRHIEIKRTSRGCWKKAEMEDGGWGITEQVLEGV